MRRGGLAGERTGVSLASVAANVVARAAIAACLLVLTSTSANLLNAQQAADTTKPRSQDDIARARLRGLATAERRDTTRADTSGIPPERGESPTLRAAPSRPGEVGSDSLMRALMELPGFTPTQYSGATALFRADSSKLLIFGGDDKKAIVVREGQTLTADSTLTFDQNTGIACGYGRPVITGEANEQPVQSQFVCFDTRQQVGMAVGARTQVSQGANWFVTGDLFTRGPHAYTKDGKFTDCSLEVPHYHFGAEEMKVVRGDVLVARNVTLNFGDVPVFWLPFMMQSLKRGRRSGLLMPEFSVNDIVRRSTTYNRRLTNLGFYWAINDNLGSAVTMDWWSNNYTALQGSFDYNFLDKFMSGGATVKHFWRESGRRELTLAARHNWQPDEQTTLNLDALYASSSTFIEEQSYDPRELRQSIASNLGVSRGFGWGNVNLKASRNHYITEDRVDVQLPSLGVTFNPITLFGGATWRVNGSFNRRTSDRANTELDPSGVDGFVSSSMSFGNFGWSQNFNANDTRAVSADSLSLLTTQRYDWSSSLNFTQRLIGTSTLTPGISVRGGTVRSPLSGNTLVQSPLRIDANASLKTDLFGFWPGIASISRFRHRLSPTISYSYSPAARIDSIADPLRFAVFGRQGIREQNQVSIGVSQTIEGKYRETETESAARDSAAADSVTVDPTQPRRLPQPRKVSVLSLTTNAVVYDFVAARAGEHGIQTTQLTNSINSDLLKGLQLTLTHDLFASRPVSVWPALRRGVPATGVATGATVQRDFSPHLRNVTASFSLNSNSWLFRFLGLGGQTAAAPETGSPPTPTPAEAEAGPSNQNVPQYGLIGNRERQPAELQPARGTIGSWNASFNLTLDRPRPGTPGGFGNQMMTTVVTFQPTQHWNVNWSTGYSFTGKEFTDHVLTLTRQMHDWDANFDFVKAQNGNFSFHFRVHLRANPDLKFDYDQRSQVNQR